MDINEKLTEDETVELLMDFLKSDGYNILDYCKGHTRGIDIISEKNNRKLLIEVKGARANHNSKIKKRLYFDSGQIKDHFGKAIVKSLEMKTDNPDCDDHGPFYSDEELIDYVKKLKQISYKKLNPNKEDGVNLTYS